jgi:carbon-monoxide dehydrogenase small subunit
MVPVGNVIDKHVLTIEGYSLTKRFEQLKDAYSQEGAVQCGFCTPGMMMASEALLRHNPHPTDEEIRDGISGNLCRCTGYNMIIKAIKRASDEGDGLW